MKVGSMLHRGSRKGQIPATKRAVIPKKPDGRRVSVTSTGHFGARRERPRVRSRAAKINRARAPPGRPATQPDAPTTAEERAKRAHGIKAEKCVSFNNASRPLLKHLLATQVAPRTGFGFKVSNFREDHFLFDREMRASVTHSPSCHRNNEMRNIRVHPRRAGDHYCSLTTSFMKIIYIKEAVWMLSEEGCAAF